MQCYRFFPEHILTEAEQHGNAPYYQNKTGQRFTEKLFCEGKHVHIRFSQKSFSVNRGPVFAELTNTDRVCRPLKIIP